MLKRLTMLLFVFVLLASASFCADPLAAKTMSLGFDLPTLGWLNHNDKGEVISDFGLNTGFGISYRGFFNPVKTNQFNPYWSAGTILLILPYIGIGADYVWDSGFYVGVGTFYVIPEVHLGVMF